MRVLLIGSYPPPLGGVSVFMQRYKSKLEREGNSVDIVDPTKLGNIRLVIELLTARARSYDLISLNYPSVPVARLLLTLGLASHAEFWDHNWRVVESWSEEERKYFERFMHSCQRVILVSSEIRNSYELCNIKLPAATMIQNAFIPPPEEKESEILNTYPATVREFLNRRKPLIVANAFKLIIQDGIDLYGLDLCVELAQALKAYFPASGFLFALAETGESEYYEKISERISQRQLVDHFCFLTGQKEFWPVLKRADLMVRPTFTDGYALSVAESIYFDCPVVASDAAVRPEGVVLFKNRDREDFVRKCLTSLSKET